jgi:hypothetical protein
MMLTIDAIIKDYNDVIDFSSSSTRGRQNKNLKADKRKLEDLAKNKGEERRGR